MSGLSDPKRAFAQAMELHRAGRLGPAEAEYRAVLGRVPGHVAALLNLATLLDQTHRTGEADAVLARAIDADARRSEAALAMAQRLVTRRDHAAAVELLEAHRARADDPPPVRLALAKVLMAWAHHGGGAEHIARAETLAAGLGETPGARGVWILALVMLDRQGEARAVLDGLMGEQVNDQSSAEAAHAVLGWLRTVAGPQPGADQALKPLTARGSFSLEHLARAHAAMARMLRQVRLPQRAREQALVGVRLDASCISAQLEVARACRVLGELDEAQRALEPIAAADRVLGAPARTGDDRARKVALFELGCVLDKQGEHERGLACVSRAKASLLIEPDASQIPVEQYPAFVARHEQWIEACDPSAWPTRIEADPGIDDGRPDPVFFVGFPRSGTTLTEQILASHPALGASGEAPIIEKTELAMRRQLGIAHDDGPGWLADLSDERVGAMRDLYFEHAAEELGVLASAGRVVDKLPLNIVRLPFVRRVFPRAKVLVALRDPRDVCISCTFQLFGLNRAMVHLFDLERTVALYQRVMGLYLAYRDKLGLTILQSRYEDLVADTPGQARRIIDFLGLDWDDRVLDFHERASERVIATPSADQVTQRIYATSVARWKRYEGVAGEQLESLADIAGQLGYGC